jgi:hypothetical protein
MSKTNRTFWLERVRRSSIGLTIAGLAGLLIGIAATTEAVDKIFIWAGLKPNALQLAKDDERAKFSRELARAAWNRLFVMQRYVSAVKENYPQVDQDKEWERYVTTLLDWNRDVMFNILSLQQYYGTAKRNEFEYGIQPQFGKLHSCLVVLRRPSPNTRCPLTETNDIAVIESGFQSLNNDLYCFVSGLPDKNEQCTRF